MPLTVHSQLYSGNYSTVIGSYPLLAQTAVSGDGGGYTLLAQTAVTVEVIDSSLKLQLAVTVKVIHS